MRSYWIGNPVRNTIIGLCAGGDKVYRDLFSLTDEAEMGHIQLSRDADLVVVAPATANILAKPARGWGRSRHDDSSRNGQRYHGRPSERPNVETPSNSK